VNEHARRRAWQGALVKFGQPIGPFAEEKLDQAELGSTQLEDFFPDLVVLWKFFVVSDGQGVDPVRSHFVGRLHFGMRGDAAAESHAPFRLSGQ